MTTILPDKEDLGLGWMHLYEQERPHGPALIVGNRKALELLRQAIDDALFKAGGEAKVEVFARDGEGYHVTVELQAVLHNLGDPPYAR